MCGIVGYVGREQAAPILLDGLSRLEYRGYDSAGVAVYHDGQVRVAKSKGRLQVLSDMIQGGRAIPGTIGIGHTRWATHGAPSDTNSHPHVSHSGKIAVVHNGIIENYAQLKSFLQAKGVPFVSETDSEVVAQLVEYFYEGDLLAAVGRVLHRIEGAYALGILNGRSATTFDPDSPITRQEAASILMRCYRLYGGTYEAADRTPALSDWNSVADWARDDAAAVLELKVMQGSGGAFDPQGTYTREQAVLTLLRLYANAPVSRGEGNIPDL